MDAQATSHGIEALIARLHGEGVQAGRREGERLVSEAREAAAAILVDARAEADGLLSEARTAATAEIEAARHAFDLARRDAVLALREALCDQLAGRLQRMISLARDETDLLHRVLLAAVRADGTTEPKDIDQLLADVTRTLVSGGAELQPSPRQILVRLDGEKVCVDISDATLAELLAAHIMPRFLGYLGGATVD